MNPMNPLEGMHDIAMPANIGLFPLAIGWWVIIALLVIAILVGLVKWFKHYQLCKKQRHALAQLSQGQLSNETIVSILKWAALQYFPRKQVASLFGQQFQQFLMNSLPQAQQAEFHQLSQAGFSGLYQAPNSEQSNASNSQFQQAAKLWLTQALPVKAQALPSNANIATKETSHD